MSQAFAPTPFNQIKQMVKRFVQRMRDINNLPGGPALLKLDDHFLGFYLSYSELRRIADKFEEIEGNGECLFIFGLEPQDSGKENMTICALATDANKKISQKYISDPTAALGEEKWPVKTTARLNLIDGHLTNILAANTPC